MRSYLNMGHMQFDLQIADSVEQVIGKMIHADEQGCQILIESDGSIHGYAWHCINHICPAP